MSLPNHAYLVVSAPHPLFATAGTDWTEKKTHSIHTDPSAAKVEAQNLRLKVFEGLAAGRAEREDFVDRMLTYRKSIKVVICKLDKIATAVVE